MVCSKRGLISECSMLTDVKIQRCWIVWNRWWLIIALPVLLIVAELGTGLTSLIWQLIIPPNELLTHAGEVLTAVSLATWAITCTLTVLTMSKCSFVACKSVLTAL